MRYPGSRALSVALGVLSLVALGWTVPGVARAFSVSPVIIDLDVDPGAAGQGSVSITNTNEVQTTYYVSIQNFVAKGEEGQQDFLPEEDRSGLAGWITPEVRQITMAPKEKRAFTYVVNVPKGAEPGGHYAAMFFSTVPPSASADNYVGVGAKTGILFLLRVPGDIREDARVESFKTGGDLLNRLPVYFELRVRNLGNIHFRPEGHIVIKNIFGQETATTPLNPRKSAVLPNSIRRIDSAWALTFDIPKDGFFTELKNEWNNFAIGKYTAEVDGVYGVERQPLSARTTFWVIPWHVLIVGFGLLVIIMILLKMYNRMVVMAAIKKQSRISKQ